MSRRRKFYIAALKLNGLFEPVQFRVGEFKGVFKIGSLRLNQSRPQFLIYHWRGEQSFATEAEAQAALDDLARAFGWIAYQNLERWTE